MSSSPVPVASELPEPTSEWIAKKITNPNLNRNFRLLALYYIVMRTGWILKTESIIMPAVLDYLGGTGALRGCLPLLNRFGQSISGLLSSGRVKIAPQKKWVLLYSTLGMGLSFLLLSLMWWITGGAVAWWMKYAFLGLYTAFFMCIGVSQLSFNSLQGKLIPVQMKGRLLSTAGLIGGICAVIAALFLMRTWEDGGAGFGILFAISGGMFALSSLAAVWLAEARDNYQEPAGVGRLFSGAIETLRRDRAFALLCLTAILFGVSMMLFPHYQALARARLGLGGEWLLFWTIIQNVGTSLFSVPTGWLADRRGNRIVLQVMLAVLLVAPLGAVSLAAVPEVGKSFYSVIYVFVGLTPVVIKSLNSYALEMSSPEDHPVMWEHLTSVWHCLSCYRRCWALL